MLVISAVTAAARSDSAVSAIPSRRQIERVAAAGVRQRHERSRHDHDERRHLRVDVAEHAVGGGAGERRERDAPARYRPRSKGCGPASENTLWKIASSFGNSTVDPTGMAITLGLECLVLLSQRESSGLPRRGDVHRLRVDDGRRRSRAAGNGGRMTPDTEPGIRAEATSTSMPRRGAGEHESAGGRLHRRIRTCTPAPSPRGGCCRSLPAAGQRGRASGIRTTLALGRERDDHVAVRAPVASAEKRGRRAPRANRRPRTAVERQSRGEANSCNSAQPPAARASSPVAPPNASMFPPLKTSPAIADALVPQRRNRPPQPRRSTEPSPDVHSHDAPTRRTHHAPRVYIRRRIDGHTSSNAGRATRSPGRAGGTNR